MDPDAAAYITAVESADGQALEEKVKIAIDNFVLGCKADGVWDAIKASCILAGARTLDGALVPLAGTAPTNFNFVAGDYDRKTGLKSDGSTKYLNTNRANDADQQDNRHRSAWVTQAQLSGFGVFIGAGTALDAGADYVGFNDAAPEAVFRCVSSTATGIRPAPSQTIGFFGQTRLQSSNFILRFNSFNFTAGATSTAPFSGLINVFRRSSASPANSNARLAFYSIGESLDLALLDARVTDLINKFAEVIP
jgi:hypothetical protein